MKEDLVWYKKLLTSSDKAFYTMLVFKSYYIDVKIRGKKLGKFFRKDFID